MDCLLILPHGEALIMLMISPAGNGALEARAYRLRSIQTTDLSACNLELLAAGEFPLLDGDFVRTTPLEGPGSSRDDCDSTIRRIGSAVSYVMHRRSTRQPAPPEAAMVQNFRPKGHLTVPPVVYDPMASRSQRHQWNEIVER